LGGARRSAGVPGGQGDGCHVAAAGGRRSRHPANSTAASVRRDGIAAGRTDELPTYSTDRWLADCTLYGPAARVREGVEQWREAGITTPVVAPLSPDGNQMNGLKAVFAAFER
jgi:hypothetical protein